MDYPTTTEETKTPVPARVRPDAGRMDKMEVQALVSNLIQDASSFSSELSDERAELTRYYNAEPFGNEEEGRSRAILSVVRDTIRGMKPSLLRVVFGAEAPLDFQPTKPEGEDQARQATDYVRMVIELDNDGERILEDAMDDGLIREMGVVKWFWEEGEKEARKQRLDEAGIEALAADPAVTLTSIGDADAEDGLAEVEYTIKTGGRARFVAIPNDEVLMDREATSIEDAILFGHRTEKTKGELIAMGLDKDVVEEFGDPVKVLDDTAERQARFGDQTFLGAEPEAGDANAKTLYTEAYIKLDVDGDGVAELRRICCIGSAYHVAVNEPAVERPFSAWSPITVAHALKGQGVSRLVAQPQLIESSLMRGGLDSLSASIFPRTWYRENDANLKDVLNTAIGAPIRTKSGSNAVGTFNHSFAGKEIFSFLEYYDQRVERSTGQSNGAAGIDADALQSSTPGAVDAAVTGSQQHVEMISRAFISQLLKPLYRGLYRQLVENQPQARVVRLRGEWVTVDPKSWDADLDVRVTAPLGAGLVQQRLQTLLAVKATQEQTLATLGPQNPLTTLGMYRNTLDDILKLGGFINIDKYFLKVDDAALAAAAAEAAKQGPPPDPAMALAQAQIQLEQQKAQADMQIKQFELQAKREEAAAKMQFEQALAQQKLEFEMYKARLEDDRQRDKQAADIALQEKELQLKYAVKAHEVNQSAEIERERVTSQAGPDGE